MNYVELTYPELSALLSQSSDKDTVLRNVHHLDRKTMFVVCALQAFPQYRSWWQDLCDDKRDDIFETVKSALRDAHHSSERGPVKEAIKRVLNKD